MTDVTLPVRFTANEGVGHQFDTLALTPGASALLLVDCDGDCGPAGNRVIAANISPALRAARSLCFAHGTG
jgi:hypothetical protein